MSSPESENQESERPADCLLDCLTPREKRRAILGDDVIAHIRAEVDAAPDPTPEVVDALRRIMTRPAGKIPKPRPTCRPFTFAEAEAAFGADRMETVKRYRRKAPQSKPEQLLCGRRLIDTFGEPQFSEPET